ncbi:hypothetical protein BKA56DRAFT_280282 [Ilyonectria sp. MPI-CAGE-AT-0026]|nr:hypothetical protein BKA56DRAFT_280282 [Ilyonectria sp. MPI-CAGE-AT-0026]
MPNMTQMHLMHRPLVTFRAPVECGGGGGRAAEIYVSAATLHNPRGAAGDENAGPPLIGVEPCLVSRIVIVTLY